MRLAPRSFMLLQRDFPVDYHSDKDFLLVWDLKRIEPTTKTAWIYPSCSNQQSYEYRFASILQLTNKPNNKFLGNIKS